MFKKRDIPVTGPGESGVKDRGPADAAHALQRGSKGTVLALRGRVDLDTSPRIRKALLDGVEYEQDIHVDLSEVTYMDSAGVACLVEAFQIARRKKTRFALVAMSQAVTRVLTLARLNGVFPVYGGTAAAESTRW